MEKNQNQEVQQHPASAHQGGGKSSGGSRGHGGRGRHHRRPAQRKPSEEGTETRQQATAYEEKERADKPAAQKPAAQGKSGEKSRSQSRRGRGRGNGGKDRAAEPTTAAQGAKEGRGRASAEVVNPEIYAETPARGSAFDRMDSFHTGSMLDDSFLPIHEEHKPDPEAEKYAAAVLDAEGPLLFSNAIASEEGVSAAEDTEAAAGESEDDTPVEIVGIRFRRTGKVYFFDPGALKLRVGGYAVVETARGLEYGEVARANTLVPQKQIVPPLRPVIRAATEEDVRHYADNKARESEAFRICQEKIAAHGLDMKLVETEYTFDNTKLLFYFTSAGRVDFRELVKDLAGVFRTRIELRQIGIRDEAKLLGGLGTCGRPLCCASFLADFVQVSIKMAKEQSLSLNSTKISGCCGRLMCCLRYESDTYEEEIRRTPSVGSLLQTPDGQGNVIANNPLRGTVRVRLGGEEGTIKEFHRDQVQVLKRVATVEEE